MIASSQKEHELSDPTKKSNEKQFAIEEHPEPQIELTGFNQPSAFGQLLSSGLNVLSTLSGKKNAASHTTNANPSKPKESTYKPTWNGDNFAELHIEHTNFTSAIREYNQQQENPKVKRGQPPPLIVRKQKPPMPFIYKFALFAVFVVIALGAFIYVDTKYNIRQTIQEMKDPSKAKLKFKRKVTINEE
jgi:hypothetical protein